MDKKKRLMHLSKESKQILITFGALASFYFLFGIEISIYRALYNALFITSCQFLLVFINNKKVLPRTYSVSKRRYYVIISHIGFLFVVVSVIFDRILIEYFQEDFYRFEKPKLIFQIMFYLVLYGLSVIIGNLSYFMDLERANNKKIQELHQANIETELKFLKSQINPHFLFNALNNIYTISYIGDSSAPNKILILSDMLRYILYDCKADFVPLSKEIDYINNYIEFQQLKTEENQNITFEYDDINKGLLISPMIFIPFIENSFKHSKIEKSADGFVHIRISQKKYNLVFEAVNSIPDTPRTKMLNKPEGIGLENVKKRLALVYHGQHSLDINKSSDEFTIRLEIKSLGHGKV